MPRYNHIKPFERKMLRKLIDMGCSKAKMAYVLDRSRSTISRELERNGYIDQAGKFVYDPEHAQLQSRNRKAQAGYGKGRRSKGFPEWKSYFELFVPIEYRPQYGRWRQYWAHEFKNRKKDLRAYCALNYYWRSSFGWIWRKKYKQKRYIYSQPPVFPRKRPKRRRPLYHWLFDHQDFRVWKKRKRKLKSYSLLELDVMKMCRKKRVRKNRKPYSPILYQWPKRFWEAEGLWGETEEQEKLTSDSQSIKDLSQLSGDSYQPKVIHIQDGKTTPGARDFEPVLKICA